MCSILQIKSLSVILFIWPKCVDKGDIGGHVTCCNQRGVQGVVCLVRLAQRKIHVTLKRKMISFLTLHYDIVALRLRS